MKLSDLLEKEIYVIQYREDVGEPVKKKKFESEEELDTWYQKNGSDIIDVKLKLNGKIIDM